MEAGEASGTLVGLVMPSPRAKAHDHEELSRSDGHHMVGPFGTVMVPLGSIAMPKSDGSWSGKLCRITEPELPDKLGQDIRDARMRRRLPAEMIAERAFTTGPSLRRIETGDHAVAMSVFAAVLQAPGLLDGLAQVDDPSTDRVGLALSAEALPEPLRLRRQKGDNDAG